MCTAVVSADVSAWSYRRLRHGGKPVSSSNYYLFHSFSIIINYIDFPETFATRRRGSHGKADLVTHAPACASYSLCPIYPNPLSLSLVCVVHVRGLARLGEARLG